MKFSNLKKATLLSVLAAGIMTSEVNAAGSDFATTKTQLDAQKASNDPLQDIYNWLTLQVFDSYQSLLQAYQYFFSFIPGWFSVITPAAGEEYAPGLAGSVKAGQNAANQVTVDAVKQADGTWVENVSVKGEPKIPVPIDGGASLLLAAGAAYGLKRLRRRKGETSEN